jgi:signal transduction histidine kinase
VPVLIDGRPYAVLWVAGADEFTAGERELLDVLAVAGGKAIRAGQEHEAARQRRVATANAVLVALERERREAILAERERLAQQLHDGPMQRVFAAGLRLQVAGPIGLSADDVAAVVSELDETVRDVRAVIVSLRTPAADYLTGGSP